MFTFNNVRFLSDEVETIDADFESEPGVRSSRSIRVNQARNEWGYVLNLKEVYIKKNPPLLRHNQCACAEQMSLHRFGNAQHQENEFRRQRDNDFIDLTRKKEKKPVRHIRRACVKTYEWQRLRILQHEGNE